MVLSVSQVCRKLGRGPQVFFDETFLKQLPPLRLGISDPCVAELRPVFRGHVCASARLRRRRYVAFAHSAPTSHKESIESAQVLSSTVPAGTPASPSLATLSLSHDCGCFPRDFPQSFRRRPVRLPPRRPAHVTCVPPSHGGLTRPSPLRRAARARARDQPHQCSALCTWSFTFTGP